MDPLDIILILAGLGILAIGFIKIGNAPKLKPAWAILGCVVLVGAGFVGSANIAGYFETASVAPTPTGTPVSCPEFQITPTASAGNGVINSAEDEINIPYLANTTGHTIDEGDNTTWVNSAVSFLISPTNLEQGADNTATATVYYEVMNPGQTVDSSSGTYYMVTKTSGRWNNIFTGSGTEYNSGSHTMTITSNVTIVLTVTSDTTGMSYVSNTYQPQTLTVRFYNGCGWQETFDINYICTLSSANAT